MEKTMVINGPSTKHAAIKKKLIRLVGTVKPGERLLPERELALNFDVSRPTLRRAVDDLVKAGFVKRIQGSGVYVNRTPGKVKRKVCIVCDRIPNPTINSFTREILNYLEFEALKRGITLLTTPIENGVWTMPDIADEGDGFIITSYLDPSILPAGKPVVDLFDPSRHLPGASYLMIDDHHAGSIVSKYLIRLGHKQICFVGDNHFYWARERYRGVCDALSETALPQPVFINIDIEKAIGNQVLSQISKDSVTALICANDSMAMGTISALHKKGIRVPEDISVTGFDDLAVAASFEPSLTTVKLPAREAAAIALKELEERIASEGKESPKKILLPAELIIRKSCASPVVHPCLVKNEK